jgi:hypothetical protein
VSYLLRNRRAPRTRDIRWPNPKWGSRFPVLWAGQFWAPPSKREISHLQGEAFLKVANTVRTAVRREKRNV